MQLSMILETRDQSREYPHSPRAMTLSTRDWSCEHLRGGSSYHWTVVFSTISESYRYFLFIKEAQFAENIHFRETNCISLGNSVFVALFLEADASERDCLYYHERIITNNLHAIKILQLLQKKIHLSSRPGKSVRSGDSGLLFLQY